MSFEFTVDFEVAQRMFCRVALLTSGCLLLGTAFLLAILCIAGVLPAGARAPRGTDNARARRGTDVESVTKTAFCAASSYVPYVGAVMCAVAEVYWPEASESDLLSQVEQRMERFAKKSVLELESRLISSKMESIRLAYQSYLQAGNVQRGSKLTVMLHICGEIYLHILKSTNVHCFVLQTIAMGSLHLSLLREQMVAGATIFPGQNHTNDFWARELNQWEKKYGELYRKSYASWETVRLDVTVTHFSTATWDPFSHGFWFPEHGFRVKDHFLDEVIKVENYYENGRPPATPGGVGFKDWLELEHRKPRYHDAEARVQAKRAAYISDLLKQMIDSIDHVAKSTVHRVWQHYSNHSTCTIQAPWFVREDRLFEVTFTDRQESFMVGPRSRILTFFDQPFSKSDDSKSNKTEFADVQPVKVPDDQAVPA